MATRLIHGRYCSAEHKQAYFESMDRLGLERLAAAKPRSENLYQPCTKALALEGQSQPEPAPEPVAAAPKTAKSTARIRAHLDLAQGEAAIAGV